MGHSNLEREREGGEGSERERQSLILVGIIKVKCELKELFLWGEHISFTIQSKWRNHLKYVMFELIISGYGFVLHLCWNAEKCEFKKKENFICTTWIFITWSILSDSHEFRFRRTNFFFLFCLHNSFCMIFIPLSLNVSQIK